MHKSRLVDNASCLFCTFSIQLNCIYLRSWAMANWLFEKVEPQNSTFHINLKTIIAEICWIISCQSKLVVQRVLFTFCLLHIFSAAAESSQACNVISFLTFKLFLHFFRRKMQKCVFSFHLEDWAWTIKLCSEPEKWIQKGSLKAF